MADANNSKHKDYARYAAHCLNLVPALKDQQDRAINEPRELLIQSLSR